MASIFDEHNPNDRTENFVNAQLSFFNGYIPEKWHRSQKKPKSLMSAHIESPGFKKLMNKMGKSLRKNASTKPVDFMIYNDASRKPTESEEALGIDKIFYAKFQEYGWTDRGGNWHDGLRLYAKTAHIFKKMLAEEYKKMPDKFGRENVRKALETACDRYINLLSSMTPVDTTKMRDSWGKKDISG